MKPELTADERRAVEAFKQGVRDSFESLATDACDYLTFNGNVNGAAIDLRDRMASRPVPAPRARGASPS
jgi:hypothetical protein